MNPVPGTSPLEPLGREHRLISRTLDALEVCASHIADGDDDAMTDLGQFATFFSEFGELTHHVKEEDVMTPYLVRIGFSYNSGWLSRVRSEHDQERYLVDVLHQAAEQEGGWSQEDRRHALAAIFGFIEFQRAHIHIEEDALFPEIMQRLSEKQRAELGRLLQEFDESARSRATANRLWRMADDFIRRYAAEE